MSRLRLLLSFLPSRTARQPLTGRYHVPPHQLEPLQSGIRWSYFWYASILAMGITTGLGARQFAAPLGLPVPGSREDNLILQSLGQDADRLDIVQSLRKQSFDLHSDAPITGTGSTDGLKAKGWVEVEVDVANDAKVDELGSKGILGAISGTRGLGVQRAFQNAETKELVAVVWIGGGLAGWPSVAHGGAIATIFEESMARMVRGPVGAIEQIHRPNSISITYAKPTHTLDFYILRAAFSQPDSPDAEPLPKKDAEPARSWLGQLSSEKDMTKKDQSLRPVEVIGTLESVKGELCVKVKGTFNV